MQTEQPVAIVLAAGKGTRMKSDLPKVLCPVLGRPMLDYVLDVLPQAGVKRIVLVIGYRGEDVRKATAGRTGIEFVEQTEQLGTGHAVQVCRDRLVGHNGPVLIVTGDSPLLQRESVERLLAEFHSKDGASPACLLGTRHVENPKGWGRIVRDAAGQFARIVEEKDANDDERRITEVNMSTYVFDGRWLLVALDGLQNNNRQREYYLTDCPGILKRAGHDVRALPILKPCEALSINTPEDLAIVEAEMRTMGYPCVN